MFWSVFNLLIECKNKLDDFVAFQDVPGFDHPHNIRSFFGCDVEEKYRIVTTTTLAPPRNTPTNTGLKLRANQRRKVKRSVNQSFFQSSKTMVELIWNDIHKELTDDWILLSLMSAISLFMIFMIFKLKN